MHQKLKSNVIKIILIALVIDCIAFIAFGIITVPNGNRTVYITATGECYHSSDCSSLQYSKRGVTLEKAVNDGYRSCKRCEPPELISKVHNFEIDFWKLFIVPLLIAIIAWYISGFIFPILCIDLENINLGLVFFAYYVIAMVFLLFLTVFL